MNENPYFRMSLQEKSGNIIYERKNVVVNVCLFCIFTYIYDKKNTWKAVHSHLLKN